jgi:hypothetical protein
MPVGSGREAGFMGLSNWLKTALNRLCEVLRRRPEDVAPANLHEYAVLARFIFQAGHYRKSPPAKPKPGAFLPKANDQKISAIWRDLLSEQEIWEIGDAVGATRTKQPLARAEFDIETVSQAKLAIEPDPKPHPRHVNLSGWPADKAEQKSIALHLCAHSTLFER